MADSTDLSSSSSPSSAEPSTENKICNKRGNEKKIWETFRLILKKNRAGFSDAISSLDLAQLRTELERIDEQSVEPVPDDCLTDTAESKQSVQKLSTEIAESKQSVAKPSTGTVESKQSVAKPSTEIAESKQSVAKPSTGTAESKQSVAKPSTGTAESKQSVEKPSTGTAESKQSVEKPLTETAESKQSVEKPSSETAEPESNSSKTSTSSDSKHQNSSNWRGFFPSLRKGVAIPIYGFPPLIPKFTRKKGKRIKDKEELIPQPSIELDTDAFNFKASWKNFTFAELQEATDNFSHENLIGEGGYAEVYKGKVEDGNLVAVKKLMRGSPEEMTMDFLSELGIIVHVDHPNIAKLIGYGVEGGMHLVLQLSAHGSLASLLYGPKEKLNWRMRFRIAVGTAEGLKYLHEGCQRRIIHKDIKAANVLLTEDFTAQIADFGLAKWLPDQWTHHTVSKVEGTFGYLPPEFFMYGIVNEKTDVFAYGVLLLELITGRQAVNSSQQSLVMWAKPLIKENKIKELVDPCLRGGYDLDQMNRVIAIASTCIHQSAANRPQMSQVVSVLKGDISCLEMLREREKSVHQRTYSAEDINDVEDYNSTKQLSDFNRQLELLLGNTEDTL
ncbi:receptor-like cytosolic serine/threonine-protein kinase RBK2 [Hibiscus syriacus]|uniref:receptor-like cytosolic serine/threonine-protein kinase RBK2 n=1 Tax=Hibiscus syriacus TaxID=106335 RepID=UPI0019227348|nr:receptor-like cytosolic serine/threonine-protein kinase RBK2 [Hibiscus syriacus]